MADIVDFDLTATNRKLDVEIIEKEKAEALEKELEIARLEWERSAADERAEWLEDW